MLKEVFKVEWKWYQIESESTQRNEEQWAILWVNIETFLTIEILIYYLKKNKLTMYSRVYNIEVKCVK